MRVLQDLSPRDQSSNATVKVTVALNKVDLVSPKSNVPRIVQDVKLLLGQAQHCAVDEFFLVCALQGRGEGVADLTRHLASLATLQPWLHDRHTVSTSTLESIVVEMVRERLFYHIRQEVPYACRVVVQECETFEQHDGRSAVRAVANIVVKKSLHKVSRSCASFHRAHNSLACIQSMVIGPGGSNIRKICQEAEVTELCHNLLLLSQCTCLLPPPTSQCFRHISRWRREQLKPICASMLSPNNNNISF